MSPGLEQNPDHILVTSGTGVHQRGVAGAGLGIDISSVGDQQSHDI